MGSLQMKSLINQILEIGLSKEPVQLPFLTDEPKFYNFLAYPRESNHDYSISGEVGQGYDKNITKAKIKSLGELVERICLRNPEKKRLIYSNYEGNNFQDPASLFCYSSQQVKRKKEIVVFLREEKYLWIKSEDILNKKEAYIPAQVVYLSQIFKNEIPIRKEQISTGAAFGKKGDNLALKSGFLECIERDGLMGFYLNKVEGRKIGNFPKRISSLIDYLERYNLETHIFDVTSDLGVPTIFTMTLDRTGLGDAVNIGSKASFNYEEALKGSIMESLQCRVIGRLEKSESSTPKENQIFSLEDRFSFWKSLERLEDINYLIKEPISIDYQKIKKKKVSFSDSLSVLRNKGYSVIKTDITLPEVNEKGFEVLKVIIPELHPMYLDERAKALYSVHYGEIKNNPRLKPHPVT